MQAISYTGAGGREAGDGDLRVLEVGGLVVPLLRPLASRHDRDRIRMGPPRVA